MELSFLYAIPRTPILDTFFLLITKIAGSYGQLWVVVGAAMLIPKKNNVFLSILFISFRIPLLINLYRILFKF